TSQVPPPAPPSRRAVEPEAAKRADRDAALDQWVKGVSALPPEKQVEVVAAELKRRNPGFSGDVTWAKGNDVVTDLKFQTDQVTDLSPLRALPGLTDLTCNAGGKEPGPLA